MCSVYLSVDLSAPCSPKYVYVRGQEARLRVQQGPARLESLTYRNSESGSVISLAEAEGNRALVIALSLNAAKYTSYTSLMSAGRAGSTTNPIVQGWNSDASKYSIQTSYTLPSGQCGILTCGGLFLTQAAVSPVEATNGIW